MAQQGLLLRKNIKLQVFPWLLLIPLDFDKS